MVGRNLFADTGPRVGRNLLADPDVPAPVVPEAPNTLQARAQEVFGFDPSIVQRGTILPIGRTAEGDVELAVPQIGVDVLTSALAPGEAARGIPGFAEGEEDRVELTPQDAALFTADFLLPGTRPFNAPRSAMTRRQFVRGAPSTEDVQTQARGALSRAQGSGTVVSDDAFGSFVDDLGAELGRSGANQDLHPTVTAAFNALRRDDQFATMARGSGAAGPDDIVDAMRRANRGLPADAPIGMDVDNLITARRQIGAALRSTDPDERRLGGIMAERFDDFVSNLQPEQLTGGTGAGVGENLAEFRRLWQRAKKSETLDLAIEAAREQASGFENGLRTQFRQILRNPKRVQGFTDAERDAMRNVVNGGPVRAALRLLGKASFGTNQGTNFLGGTIGVGAGSMLGGPTGAMLAPVAGLAGQRGAQRSTLNAANMARAMAATGAIPPPAAGLGPRVASTARGLAFPTAAAAPMAEPSLLELLMQIQQDAR